MPFVSRLPRGVWEDGLLVVERARNEAEGSKCLWRQHDPPRLSVLWLFDTALAVECSADRRAAVRNVEVAPSECGELARPHAGVRGEQDQRRGLLAVVAVLLWGQLGELLDLGLRL